MICIRHDWMNNSNAPCPFCSWNESHENAFQEEAALNPQFTIPKEDIAISVDILKLPSYWQQFKNWWNS